MLSSGLQTPGLLLSEVCVTAEGLCARWTPPPGDRGVNRDSGSGGVGVDCEVEVLEVKEPLRQAAMTVPLGAADLRERRLVPVGV